MEGKLTQTRLVETELGRLIEGTTVSVQRPKLKTKKPRKDKAKAADNAPPSSLPASSSEGTLPASSSDVPPSATTADEAALPLPQGAGSTSDAAGPSSTTIPIPAALPPPPAPFYPPAPSEPSGPDTYALLAQADAEGLLGVVNYRRKGART